MSASASSIAIPDLPASPQIAIIPVNGKAQMAEFIALPRRIYAGMPGFAPPLDFERQAIFDPKAAFFRHGRAAYFLARSGGRLVGRISAQIDDLAIEAWGEPIGMFGALDAIDDVAVTAALLAAATGWLRAAGMARARGPYMLNPTGESGLMVTGQMARQMVAMPWHPPYLAQHMAALGWTKAMDLLAYELEINPESEARQTVPRMRLNRGELTLRTMRPKQIAEDAEILRRLYNDAWANNWGFVPITSDEIQAMVKEMKPILKPEHYFLVERNGEPLAVALLVPNLFDIAGDLRGAPSPLGWVKFVTRLLGHRFHSGRVILLGVSASLRNTTLGAIIPSLVIQEIFRRLRTMPIKHVEMSWVLETNSRMRRLIEELSPEPNKVYRLYEKEI